MKKLCVLFPGIGYTCDKPLLYYSAKLARARGYEVIALKYSGFPEGAKGNDEKLRLAAAHALTQSEQQLADVDFSGFGRIVFAGKSIGTRTCLEYKAKHNIKACGVLFTPLEFTFEQSADGFCAFHGTADPWAKTDEIERLCKENALPLYEYADANHSLETGDVMRDIINLRDVMEKAGVIIA